MVIVFFIIRRSGLLEGFWIQTLLSLLLAADQGGHCGNGGSVGGVHCELQRQCWTRFQGRSI